MKLHEAKRYLHATLACALPLLPTSIAAQIAAENRAALTAKGYGQTDFKAAETTQIGSNYAFFRIWQQCVAQAGDAIIMNDINDARAGLLMSQCNDDALTLRAAIARTLGLPEATRVVGMLEMDSGMQLRRKMEARLAERSNHSARTDSGRPFWHEGLWTVQLIKNGRCGAYESGGDRNEDGRERINMMLMPNAGGYEFRFVIGHQGAASDFSKVVGKSARLKTVVITGTYGNERSSQFDVSYRVLTNGYDVFLAADQKERAFQNIMPADQLHITTQSLQPYAPVRLEVQYGIGGTESVMPHIAQCDAAQKAQFSAAAQ